MSRPKRCLLLIDLQNEFLSHQGNFPINDHSRSFLYRLPRLTDVFHASGEPVIWVRSEYACGGEEAALSQHSERQHQQQPLVLSNLSSRTHTGSTPCCVNGSFGAEFPDEIRSLISGIIVTKTWYSAFKDTTLLQELESRGIKEVFLGGVLTNICVGATASDAVDLGFDVTVVEDCLGWRNYQSHDRALQDMHRRGVRFVSSDELNSKRDPVSSLFTIPPWDEVPRLYYVNGSVPSWRVVMALYEKDVKFQSIPLKVMTRPKETRQPDFLTINHRGKTPVFLDIVRVRDAIDASRRTIAVNESIAILEYIETYHGHDRPLLPPPSSRAARALVLSRIQETENLRLAYDAFENAHFESETAGTALRDAQRLQYIDAINEELDYWEHYAAETLFIAGDEFGLADCAFYPCLAYMVHRGFTWRRDLSCQPRLESPGGAARLGPGSFGKAADIAWPDLKAYYERVWRRGGENGCAQKAQPEGWARKGKTDIWKSASD